MHLVQSKRAHLPGPDERQVAASKAAKALVAALKAGVIHPELSERLRLLPTDTQQAREFQAAINQIYQMLVKAGKVDLKDSQFLLFDDRQGGVHAPNGFYLPSSGKLFGFAAAFIRGDKAVTYDELAHVVLHELFHRHVRDKHLGADAKENKFEEGGADLYTLYCWMRDVGANPRVVVEALSKELSDTAKQHGGAIPIDWGEVEDVHVSKRTTRLLMEAALTALEIKRGDCPDNATPLSEWRVDLGGGSSKSLVEIVGNYDYVGPVKSGLTEAGYYSEKDPVRRAEIFCRILDNALPYCNSTRAMEAADALLTLRLNPALSRGVGAIDRIADSILRVITPDNFSAVHRIYSNLCLRTADFESHQPLGRLKILANAAKDFITAKTRQDVLKFAGEFVKLASAEPLAGWFGIGRSAYKYWPVHELCGDRFPRFAKFTIGGVVPWNRHLTECVLGKNRSNGWQDVVRALRMLGVEDPRVLQEKYLGAFQSELLVNPQIRVAPEVKIECSQSRTSYCGLESCYVAEGRIFFHAELGNQLEGQKLFLALKAQQWKERIEISRDEIILTSEQFREILSNMGSQHPGYCAELLSKALLAAGAKEGGAILHVVDEFLAKNTAAPELMYNIVVGLFYHRGDLQEPATSSPSWILVSRHGKALSDMQKLGIIAAQYSGRVRNGLGDDGEKYVMSSLRSYSLTERRRKELEEIVLPLASRVLGREIVFPRSVAELCALFSSDDLTRAPVLGVIRQVVGSVMLRNFSPDIHSLRSLVSKLPHLKVVANNAITEKETVRWCNADVTRSLIIDEVRDWLYAQKHNIAPAVELYRKLKTVLGVVEQLSTDRRVKIIDMLLSSSRPISDVVVLRRINRLYANALVEKFGGTDDKSDEYLSRLGKVVQKLAHNVPILIRRELFAEIADRLCTQERSSFLLRDNLNLFAEEQLTMGSLTQMLADGALNVLARSPELRGDVIDLLMSGAEPAVVDNFIYNRLPFLSISHVRARYGEAIEVSSGYSAGAFTLTAAGPNSLKHLNLLRAEARKLHEAFWEVPLYMRSAFIAELYFPDGVDQTKIGAIADTILARAIPDSAPGADVGRAWWQSYILGLPPYKIPYYLAATLSARRPGASSDRKAGDIIADIADILDPVSRKLVQVGSGHPGLPEVLRPSPERVRCELSVPTRWEYWQLINSQLSEELRSDIQYLGPVKKAGSISVAGSVDSRMHGSATLLVERDYVRETSATGVKNLKRMVSGRGADPAAVEVSRSIEAAYSLLLGELQSATLPQKAAAMAEEYAKYKIIVDDKEVTFSSADLLRSEARGKLLRTAPGTELASAVRTDESPELRVVLMGVLTRELVGILSGSRFCDDRHSGNCSKHGLSVQHYDHGGMAITPPSSDELSALGDIISKALAVSANPDELLPRLTSALTEAAADGSYISRVRKALQTLSEYTLYLPKSDVRACFAAAVTEMHPVLKAKVLPVFFTKVAQPEFSALIGSFLTTPGGLGVRVVRVGG